MNVHRSPQSTPGTQEKEMKLRERQFVALQQQRMSDDGCPHHPEEDGYDDKQEAPQGAS